MVRRHLIKREVEHFFLRFHLLIIFKETKTHFRPLLVLCVYSNVISLARYTELRDQRCRSYIHIIYNPSP